MYFVVGDEESVSYRKTLLYIGPVRDEAVLLLQVMVGVTEVRVVAAAATARHGGGRLSIHPDGGDVLAVLGVCYWCDAAAEVVACRGNAEE